MQGRQCESVSVALRGEALLLWELISRTGGEVEGGLVQGKSRGINVSGGDGGANDVQRDCVNAVLYWDMFLL